MVNLLKEGTTQNATSTMDRYRKVIPMIQPLLRPSTLQHQSYQSLLCPCLPSQINYLNTRNFSSTQHTRSTNFDTLKVVQRLEAEGFTPEQSQAVMSLLKDVIDESILGLTRTMVTRDEQDKVFHPSHAFDKAPKTP